MDKVQEQIFGLDEGDRPLTFDELSNLADIATNSILALERLFAEPGWRLYIAWLGKNAESTISAREPFRSIEDVLTEQALRGISLGVQNSMSFGQVLLGQYRQQRDIIRKRLMEMQNDDEQRSRADDGEPEFPGFSP